MGAETFARFFMFASSYVYILIVGFVVVLLFKTAEYVQTGVVTVDESTIVKVAGIIIAVQAVVFVLSHL